MITVSVSVGNTTIIMYVLIYYSMASSNYMGDKKKSSIDLNLQIQCSFQIRARIKLFSAQSTNNCKVRGAGFLLLSQVPGVKCPLSDNWNVPQMSPMFIEQLQNIIILCWGSV